MAGIRDLVRSFRARRAAARERRRDREARHAYRHRNDDPNASVFERHGVKGDGMGPGGGR